MGGGLYKKEMNGEKDAWKALNAFPSHAAALAPPPLRRPWTTTRPSTLTSAGSTSCWGTPPPQATPPGTSNSRRRPRQGDTIPHPLLITAVSHLAGEVPIAPSRKPQCLGTVHARTTGRLGAPSPASPTLTCNSMANRNWEPARARMTGHPV